MSWADRYAEQAELSARLAQAHLAVARDRLVQAGEAVDKAARAMDIAEVYESLREDAEEKGV